MKIIVATFTFHPEVDGVAIAAGQMVDNFVTAGHEVHVTTGSNKTDLPTEEGRGFQIHRFGVIEGKNLNPGEVAKYINFLTESKPDVIIFHCWNAWPTDCALKCFKQIRAKKILLSHGYDSHIFYGQPGFPWGLRSWLKRLPQTLVLPIHLARFDCVVFLSKKRNFGRFFDAWIAKAIGCKNTVVIPNSVASNLDFVPADLKEKVGLGSKIQFICVANYNSRKNQEMALRAFCMAKIPNSRLVFIGSSLGEYGTRLRDSWTRGQADHPGLEVSFLENQTRLEVISAIKSSDVLVLSATAETQPIVILEAMACGRPFISTDTGCVSELEGGVVVGNVDEMAGQMCNLAENPNHRGALGQLARKYFERHHSPEVINQSWLDLVEEVRTPRLGSKI